MEKAAITSHKSHASCRGRRLAARSAQAVRGRRAMAPAGRGDETRRAEGEGDGGNDAAADRGTSGHPAGVVLTRVFPTTCQGSVAACMVKTSARHQTGAWPVRRTTGTEFRFGYGEGGSYPPDAGYPRRIGERHAAAYRTPLPSTRKQSRGIFCYRQDRVLRGYASRSVITSREPPRPVGPAIGYSE